jgi:hypothetical protein
VAAVVILDRYSASPAATSLAGRLSRDPSCFYRHNSSACGRKGPSVCIPSIDSTFQWHLQVLVILLSSCLFTKCNLPCSACTSAFGRLSLMCISGVLHQRQQALAPHHHEAHQRWRRCVASLLGWQISFSTVWSQREVLPSLTHSHCSQQATAQSAKLVRWESSSWCFSIGAADPSPLTNIPLV